MANDWTHVRLESRQQAKTNLDFLHVRENANSNKPSSQVKTRPAWVNVERPDLDDAQADKVRVVVDNICDFMGNSNSGYANSTSRQTQIVDLSFAEKGRFTAELNPFVIHGDHYGGTEFCRQEVAVVINGEWQDDPMQPKNAEQTDFEHNFKANLWAAAQPRAAR